MKNILKIIGISAGIISLVSMIILGCIYVDNIVEYLRSAKVKIVNKIGRRSYKYDNLEN